MDTLLRESHKQTIERQAVLRELHEFEREFDVSLEGLSWELGQGDVMSNTMMNHYFRGGLWAIRCIWQALDGRQPANILDFGCGHGRVSRFLKVLYPQARLTVSDIDADGVVFCEEHFGANGFLSDTDPGKIRAKGGPFDLIWVGSVFTHLDADRWLPLLRFFESQLSGTLVFTIQGPTAAERLRTGVVDWGLGSRAEELLASFDDFSYVDYPGHSGYGISLVTIEWVKRLLEKTSLEVADYNEQGWDLHQDAVSCRYHQGRAAS